jgi:hypothetical protein
VASKSLAKWLKILWEKIGKRMYGVLRVVCCCPLLFSSVPCGGGVRLTLIGQGESELHACRAIQLHGEVWCAAP